MNSSKISIYVNDMFIKPSPYTMTKDDIGGEFAVNSTVTVLPGDDVL